MFGLGSLSRIGLRRMGEGAAHHKTALTLKNPVVTAQNTTVTNALGPDGITWAQGNPLTVDKYGKLITLEEYGTNGVNFIWSNDGGSTWTDGMNSGFIIRGCLAYDSRNDICHVFWRATATTDGMIYRRYNITRDVSNNITNITRDANINLQVDFQSTGSMDYEHPILMWLGDAAYGTYGALLAIWGAAQNGTAPQGSEIRASMRILDNTINDNTAANWKAPGAVATSTIANPPSTPYSIVASSTGNAPPYVSAVRKASGSHINDIYVAYALFGSSIYTYYYRRMIWNGTNNDWSGGLSAQTLLSPVVRSGVDSGYNQKYQLITTPREDNINDVMAVGLGTWKDNTAGDSWGYVTIKNDDTVTSIVDVYTGGASNCGATIFITGDVACNAGFVIASYTDLPAKHAYVRVFDSTGTEDQAPMVFYSANPTDIPTIWQSGTNALYNSTKLILLFRDFNTAAASNPPTYSGGPYAGFFASMDLVVG